MGSSHCLLLMAVLLASGALWLAASYPNGARLKVRKSGDPLSCHTARRPAVV